MPEGDTVWRQARTLDRALRSRLLTSSDFRVPQLATTDLSGCRVEEVVSRGKHLLTRLEAADGKCWTLRSHLRMDGTWRVFAPGERWSGRPARTVRVVLRTDAAVAVGFHLHDLALVPRAAEVSLVGHLGPDLLGPDWDEEEAVRRLAAQPERDVGVALLDQRCLAGIGNLYKCEALFLAGVNPFTRVRDVPDLAKLLRLAQKLMLANLDNPMQVTTGVARGGHQHWVYGRSREACRRCGTPIRAAAQGPAPEERTTCWCPSCQR